MNIVLNGNKSNIETNTTLSELVNSKSLNKERIIIQVDEEIIKKEDFDNFTIKENSRIEVLSIVGGG